MTTNDARDLAGSVWQPPRRSLADLAVTAFRTAAGTPRQRPNPHQLRATRIAAQILEVAPPAPRQHSAPAVPPDYVPKAHPIRVRRRVS